MSEPERQASSPFDTVAETSLDRGDKLRRYFQLYISAPFKIIWGDWRARFGFSILVMYIFMGTIGTQLVREPKPLQGPRVVPAFVNWEYPLGTDATGQSVFSLLVHATPDMLKMMFAGAFVAVIIASVVGIVAGYKGGYVDTVLMTITDITLALPGLPLTIVITAIITPKNPYLVGILLTIHDWSGLARALRSQVLTLRNESYVEASRLMGVSTRTIVIRDLVPNLAPYIGIRFMGSARAVIFGSVGLYFLGILPFTSLNWGVVLNRAYNSSAMYSFSSAHWLLAPMITITLMAIGLVLISQGMDRLFNPRVRARHVDTGEESDTLSHK